LNFQIQELAPNRSPVYPASRLIVRDVLNDAWLPSWNTQVAAAVNATTITIAAKTLDTIDDPGTISDQ
jgi:hypothetical protein